MSQEVPSVIKESLQQQLQEVEQRRNDLLLEHQRAQKRSQKIQSIQDKRKNMQKETAATREEMRKIRKEIMQKAERFLLLSDEAAKHEIVEAEMVQNFKACRQEKKEEAAMRRKQLTVAGRRCLSRFSPWERKKPGFMKQSWDPSSADARKRRREKGEWRRARAR